MSKKSNKPQPAPKKRTLGYWENRSNMLKDFFEMIIKENGWPSTSTMQQHYDGQWHYYYYVIKTQEDREKLHASLKRMLKKSHPDLTDYVVSIRANQLRGKLEDKKFYGDLLNIYEPGSWVFPSTESLKKGGIANYRSQAKLYFGGFRAVAIELERRCREK